LLLAWNGKKSIAKLELKTKTFSAVEFFTKCTLLDQDVIECQTVKTFKRKLALYSTMGVLSF